MVLVRDGSSGHEGQRGGITEIAPPYPLVALEFWIQLPSVMSTEASSATRSMAPASPTDLEPRIQLPCEMTKLAWPYSTTDPPFPSVLAYSIALPFVMVMKEPM